ncbi:hypothetical protein [Streptomyces luteireticuli]
MKLGKPLAVGFAEETGEPDVVVEADGSAEPAAAERTAEEAVPAGR